MINNKQVTIEMTDNFAKVTQHNNAYGADLVKYCSVKDLGVAFAQKQIATPVFPVPVVAFTTDGSSLLVMTVRKHDMYTFEKRGRTYSFNFPYIYLLFKMRQNGSSYAIVDSRIYTSFMPPTSRTLLYTPYMNNVYDDSRICWGEAVRQLNADFTSFDSLFEKEGIFYEAIHNEDLIDSGRIESLNGHVFGTEGDWAQSRLIVQSGGRTGKTIKTIMELI